MKKNKRRNTYIVMLAAALATFILTSYVIPDPNKVEYKREHQQPQQRQVPDIPRCGTATAKAYPYQPCLTSTAPKKNHIATLMSYDSYAKGANVWVHWQWFGPVPYAIQYEVIIQPGTVKQWNDVFAEHGGTIPTSLMTGFTALCGVTAGLGPVGVICGIAAVFQYEILKWVTAAAAKDSKCVQMKLDTTLPLPVVGWVIPTKIQMAEYGAGGAYVWDPFTYPDGSQDFVRRWHPSTDHCQTRDLPPGVI